jgi:hypothetical protein
MVRLSPHSLSFANITKLIEGKIKTKLIITVGVTAIIVIGIGSHSTSKS